MTRYVDSVCVEGGNLPCLSYQSFLVLVVLLLSQKTQGPAATCVLGDSQTLNVPSIFPDMALPLGVSPRTS